MSTAQPTFDDVWRMFQEIGAQAKDLLASQQETARRFQETDRKFQETDRKFQETERAIREVGKRIGELGNRLGGFIEETVRPAAVRLFRELGIDVHEVHRDVQSERGEEAIQIDLLVVNDADTIAIECKSHLSIDDVNEHLERLEKIKRLLPKYAASRVLGAVAAMVIPDNVAKYAYRQGLYVIGQTGEHLVIRNDSKFRPKAW
ncbi:DUF3782 domain-containing protein [Gammaproteobacteria bacterium]